MDGKSFPVLAKHIRKHLLWFGIISMLVGIKLVASFIWPGLKTPGELVLSGGLLLIYSAKIWSLRSQINGYRDAEG